MFWKKSKKLTPTLLRCAHIQKKPLFELFELLDAQKKCVLGPGDVFACFLCPKFHRFVYHMENVPQTLSDAPQKFFV